MFSICESISCLLLKGKLTRMKIAMHLYGADWAIGTAMPVGISWAALSPHAIPNAHKMLRRESSSSDITAVDTEKKFTDLQDSADLGKTGILTPATPGVKSLKQRTQRRRSKRNGLGLPDVARSPSRFVKRVRKGF